MFRNTYQSGWLTVFFSCGPAPLEIWGMHVKSGWIRRVTDEEVKSLALEIAGTNVSTTYIFTPQNPKISLAINLPFLIMIIKNMKKYFTFEITVLDDQNMHRRFRISNFQSVTKVRAFSTSMPIGLCDGWNQVQFNLADFTRRAYGSNYIETTRLQIHANCRIRRIYFADRLYSDDQLPEDYKLLFPARRSESMVGKRLSRRTQPKISVEAVVADEPLAFIVDVEKIEDEGPKQTTPVASREPSRMIVAPHGASKVQIQIVAQSEDEEMFGHEFEPEYEDEEGTTTEHEDEADEVIPEDKQEAQEAASISPIEKIEEKQEEKGEEKQEAKGEEKREEKQEEKEEEKQEEKQEEKGEEKEEEREEKQEENKEKVEETEARSTEATEDEGEVSESQI